MDRTTTSMMTRERTWVLTAISVLLFVLLCEDGDDRLSRLAANLDRARSLLDP